MAKALIEKENTKDIGLIDYYASHLLLRQRFDQVVVDHASKM